MFYVRRFYVDMSQLLPEALFSKILNPAYRKSRALKKIGVYVGERGGGWSMT